MKTITLIQPDDWHVHLREGDMLPYTLEATRNTFGRALIMPNLKTALTSVALVNAYYQHILSLLANKASTFTPWMTLYLTDTTSVQDIIEAKKTGYILSAKLYPAGATTHADAGVHSLKKLYPIFERMEQQELVLNIHGEVTSSTCDIFDREAVFIEEELIPIMRNFPKLRMTLEHISTRKAVEFIKNVDHPIAATITPHHLHLNRNHMLAGGIKPHYYCLPILKKRSDQEALLHIATSGHPRFFLGTDSAPHSIAHKLSACGCAGIYNSVVALPLCATLFEQQNALEKLENFTSRFGAEFYQLPLNTAHITLAKSPYSIPEQLPFGSEWVVPFLAGETLPWKKIDNHHNTN